MFLTTMAGDLEGLIQHDVTLFKVATLNLMATLKFIRWLWKYKISTCKTSGFWTGLTWNFKVATLNLKVQIAGFYLQIEGFFLQI